MDRLRSHVDLPDFGNADGNARQEQPQRAHRIGGMDVAAGNLREERLKDEEIVAADQFDVDVAAGTPAQMLGGEHPAEAAADNDHPVPGLFRQWTRLRRVRKRRRRRELPHDAFLCAVCLIFPAESRVVALPSGHTDARGRQDWECEDRVNRQGRSGGWSGWSMYCRRWPGSVWSLSFRSAASTKSSTGAVH